jgi:hypothetical protein
MVDRARLVVFGLKKSAEDVLNASTLEKITASSS